MTGFLVVALVLLLSGVFLFLASGIQRLRQHAIDASFRLRALENRLDAVEREVYGGKV